MLNRSRCLALTLMDRFLRNSWGVAILMFPMFAAAVVGGADATDGRYPFMATLQFKASGETPLERHGCGAALVAPDWVLTAAHCLVNTQPSEVEVILGRTQLSNTLQGQTVGVKRIALHPEFLRSLTLDVALLKLDRAITGIQPIAIVMREETLEERIKRPTVLGWGNTARSPAPDVRPDHLQRARLPRMPDAQCTSLAPSVNLQNTFYIGADGLIPDSGDSGSPVFVKHPKRGFVQLGVVSQGVLIARLSNPKIAGFIREALNESP
nr:serine protease [uncultured Pseudomonas sp.]